MKNNSNIYDIDGELIRAFDDTHKLTVKEAQEKAKYYTEKLGNLDEKDPKAVTYANYIKNLNRYIMEMYSKMSPEELQELLSQKKQESTDAQVEKAINELKKEIENEENNEVEESSEHATEETGSEDTETPVRTQEDLLTDGEGRPETVMDEYVSPIGEASDEYVEYEEIPQ